MQLEIINGLCTQFENIKEALGKGNLINTDLEVVNRDGIKWMLIRIKNIILTLLIQDPWQHYRLVNVAEAFYQNVDTHKNFMKTSKKIRESIREILEELDKKGKNNEKVKQINQKVRDILNANTTEVF